MRADVVLNISRKDYLFVPPSKARTRGRSFWKTSRYFHIQGGPGAMNGWGSFSESFKVDDMESARYVSWYYTLLTKLYVQGCTTADVQAMLSADPATYLPMAFNEATGHPKNPALVLTHHGLKSILGAHLKITEGHIHWQLEARYRGLFGRIAALACAVITLYKPDGNLCVGWVWQEPGKPWSRKRAWFAESYRSSEGRIGSRWFSTPLLGDNWQIAQLYDTNIFVPKAARQVNYDSLAPGGWKPPKKHFGLRSLTKKNISTWF